MPFSRIFGSNTIAVLSVLALGLFFLAGQSTIDSAHDHSTHGHVGDSNTQSQLIGHHTSAAAAAQFFSFTSHIGFETPVLGDSEERRVINPYVDSATGVTFTAEFDGWGDEIVGLVKNRSTTACVEPPNEDQKLGTGRSAFGEDGSIGLSGFPIRATFPSPAAGPVEVWVEFQALAGTDVSLTLYDSGNNSVASVTEQAGPPDGTCGFGTAPRARTLLHATANEDVAYAIMEQGGNSVMVIDNFSFTQGTSDNRPVVAYIYRTNSETVNQFAQLFDGEGFDFQGIMHQNLGQTDLAGIDVIVIAADLKPQIGEQVWSPSDVALLEGTGKGVIGIGEGGVGYFAELDLEIGNTSNVVVAESFGPVLDDLTSPLLYYCDIRASVIGQGQQIPAFTDPVSQIGIRRDQLSTKVNVVAVDFDDPTIGTLLQEGRYVHWAYTGSPLLLTDDGKGMLRGILVHGQELGLPPTQAEEVTLIARRVGDLSIQSLSVLWPDLSIPGIEITQAIQCYDSPIPGCGDNSLPVSTNRSTAVRVYLSLGGGGLFGADQIEDVDVRLYVKAGTGSGANIFTMDGTGTAARNPLRTEATHSANFFLSIDGDGDIPVRMCAQVDPDKQIRETDETNNRFPAEGSVEKTFEERRQVEIDGLPVDYRRNNTEGAAVPSNNVVNSLAIQYLNKVWPVPDKPTGIDYQVLSSTVWNKNTDGDLGASDGSGQHALIQSMNSAWAISSIFTLLFTGEPVNDFYYGWVSASRWNAGHADMPIYPHAGGLGVVGIGSDSSSGSFQDRGTDIFAHELIHDFDVFHTNTADGCNSDDDGSDFPYLSSSIQDVGMDPVSGRIYNPANAHDLMSYCPAGGSTEGWISPFTWDKIWDEFTPSGGAASITSGDQGSQLVVSGSIGKNGSGQFSHGYVVDGAEISVPTAAGPYEVVVLDGSGTVLSREPFDVSFIMASIPGAPEIDTAYFTLFLPFPDGAQLAQLLLNGQVLDTLTVGQQAPQVSFVTPSGGEVLDGPFLVQWEDSDTGVTASVDPARRYALFFQENSGSNVTPLASDLKGTEFLLDPTRLPKTANGRLILLATENLKTTRVESSPFTVPGKSPSASIDDPADGAVFDGRDAIVLMGRGNDPDDGTLPGSSLSWSSDIDGPLGTGTVLPLAPSSEDSSSLLAALSPGIHTISMVARDSDDNTTETSIQISVLAPPSVSLLVSPDEGDAPLPVTLTAQVDEPGSGIAAYEWDIDSDGVIDVTTNTNVLNFTYENPGAFLARVTVTDQDGLKDTSLAAIQVHGPAQAVTVEIDAPATVFAGSEFNVIIQADDVQDLAGAEFRLQYDSDLFQFLNAEPLLDSITGFSDGPPCAAIHNVTMSDPSHDSFVSMALACQNGFSGAPLLLWNLTFIVDQSATPQETLLATNHIVLGDSQARGIPNFGEGIPIMIAGGICGDQNGDGDVNVLDAIIDMKIIVGEIVPTALQMVLSDLNGDGEITVEDVIMALQHIVGTGHITDCGPRQIAI